MLNSYSYCTSCRVNRYLNSISCSKNNFNRLQSKTSTSTLFKFNTFKMQFAVAFVLTVLVAQGEAGILRGLRGRADRGVEPSASAADHAYCGACDTRNCPLVSAETCRGQVVKDRCGCCPFCDTLKPAKFLVSTENNATAKAVCADIKCPRNKICLLNIQNIPICRCPSAYICRRQNIRKGYWKGGDSHLCGRDGRTYRNRCLLQVAECASNRKIRVAHRGKCLGDTPIRKKKGSKKSNSKSVTSDKPGNDQTTQAVNQYPSNQGQYSSNRDRDGTSSQKPKQGRRQKHQKIKENRKQRRKDRINRRTKRRYRIYWN